MKGDYGLTASVTTESDDAPVSNAQMIAELQGLAIGIRMFGLDGYAAMQVSGGVDPSTAGTKRSEVSS